MNKEILGIGIVLIVLIGIIGFLGISFLGLQEKVNQQQQEKQAELFLKELADMNALNFQAGTMNAINAINNQFIENKGRVVFPIFNKETNAFDDVPFLTEEECAQIFQKTEEN